MLRLTGVDIGKIIVVPKEEDTGVPRVVIPAFATLISGVDTEWTLLFCISFEPLTTAYCLPARDREGMLVKPLGPVDNSVGLKITAEPTAEGTVDIVVGTDDSSMNEDSSLLI